MTDPAESSIGDRTAIHETTLVDGCDIGSDTRIWAFANLYGCSIGSGCMIGPYVEVQEDAAIGDGVSVQSHSFLCQSMEVHDDAWIGHGVMTVNNRYPPGEPPWEPLVVEEGAVVGSGATLMPVRIGEGATVGAGAVVVEDVPPGTTVVGNPARPID